MENSERLAIGQALYKLVGKLVSTRDADSLRSECDRELLRMFEDNGIDRVQMRANGVKVGTLSVRETRPKPVTLIDVRDPDAYWRWCRANGFVVIDEKGVRDAVEADGIVPDGCDVKVVEGEPTYSTVLKVDEQAVLDAYAGKLEQPVRALLEGGR